MNIVLNVSYLILQEKGSTGFKQQVGELIMTEPSFGFFIFFGCFCHVGAGVSISARVSL